MKFHYDCYKFHKEIHDSLNKNHIKCDLTITKQANEKNPDFIINCCLFSKKKNINEYINNFHHILNIYRKNSYKKYIIRIYYDISANLLISSFKKEPNIELIEYYFNDFFNKNLQIHYGFFGTLVRFLPLFHNNYNCHMNIIMDIDTYLNLEIIRKRIALMNEYKCKLFGLVLDSKYYDLTRYQCISNSSLTVDLPLLAGSIIAKSIISPKIKLMIDFLKKIKNKDHDIINWHKYRTEFINQKDGLMVYGIDEYFLNCYWINSIKHPTRILFEIFYIYIAKLHYELIFKSIFTYSHENQKIIIEELVNLMKKYNLLNSIHTNQKEIIKILDDIVFPKKMTRFNTFMLFDPNKSLLDDYYKLFYKLANIFKFNPEQNNALINYVKFQKILNNKSDNKSEKNKVKKNNQKNNPSKISHETINELNNYFIANI